MMTGLSKRETTVAEHYGAGETYTQIAERLCIAPSTVRNHLSAIYRKLGISNKAQLIAALSSRSSEFGVLPAARTVSRSAPLIEALDGDVSSTYPGPSIAIMPFEHLGPDDRSYIAFGLAADLQHTLTQCPDLFVSGRSSSLVQFEAGEDAMTSARAIGVDYILRGTTRSADDRICVTTELVEGNTGRVRWSERYEGLMANILVIEDEAVRSIAADLALQINCLQHRTRRRLGDDELTAYDWRLRGNRLLERGGRSSIEGARACFERALAVEPNSAAALAGLSMSYGYECDLLMAVDYSRALEGHLEFAQRAVAADESDSRGHYALSCAMMMSGQYRDADRHAVQALKLNPSEYHNICNRGYSLMALGEIDESLNWFAQSLRRNPLAPNSCLLALGLMEYLEEDYGQSASVLSRMTTYQVQRAATMAAACAQVGFTSTVKNAAKEFESLSRGIPILPTGTSGAEWRTFWSRVYPYLTGDPFDHMLEGIRKAALPV